MYATNVAFENSRISVRAFLHCLCRLDQVDEYMSSEKLLGAFEQTKFLASADMAILLTRKLE